MTSGSPRAIATGRPRDAHERALAATGAALALLFASAAAHAHLRFPGVRAERWIDVRLDETPIAIGYRVGFSAPLAKEERRRADRNGDGEVSAAEGNAALDGHTDALLAALQVCSGRTLDALECRALERRDVELVEADGWIPGPQGHLHFAWTLRLGHAAADLGALRVVDGWQIPSVEITDVRIRPPPDTALTSAGEGGQPSGVATGFNWIEARRGPGPREVVATWPARAGRSWLGVAAGGALLLAGAALWLRSRRRPSPGSA